jgi:hypothetical protein
VDLTLLAIRSYSVGATLLAFLFAHCHEHILAITRLILLADVELFRGVWYPFVAASLTCVGLTAAVMIGAQDWSDRPCAPSFILSALILMLLASTAVAVDCSIPVYGVYSPTLGFAALALHLFEGSTTRS